MSQQDYFEVAVQSARYAHALEQQTHWNVWDAPISRGQQMAACGSWVSRKSISPEPTCPACRQQLAIYESLQF